MTATLEITESDRPLARTILRSMRSAMERMSGGRIESRQAPNKADDLAIWSRNFLPDHFTRAPSGMHVWLFAKCNEADRERGQRVNIIGPRGGAKSTIGTLAYPLKCACEASEPLIWIISETQGQADEHLESIKSELETNELIAAAYPQAAGKGPTWRTSRIRLRNGVAIAAFGQGKKLRGRRQRMHRPSLIVCDDIQSDAAMTSPNRREKERNWLFSVPLKAGNRRTNVLHLATALHRDAIGSELQRLPAWESRVFASIIKWPHNMALWEQWTGILHRIEDSNHKANARAFYDARRAEMDAGAEVLWPDEEDLYSLMSMREEGRNAFEREKQGRPINPEACEWPDSYFDDSIWFEDWPKNLSVKSMALDPSKGKSDKIGDYSAFVVAGFHRDGTLYVEGNLKRRPTPQIVADGVELFIQHRPNAWVVESNAWQDLLRDDIDQECLRQGVLAPSIHGMDNSVHKDVRIRRIGPWLSSRRIKFRNTPGTKLLVEQLKDFPVGDHDDGPDGLEMAIRLAQDHWKMGDVITLEAIVQ